MSPIESSPEQFSAAARNPSHFNRSRDQQADRAAKMFRSRLQELCQQRRWAPPVFEHTREGPDHSPLFRATVLVHDEKFSSPDEGARSTKEAYNLAAMAAFEHLAALPAAAPALVPVPAAPAPPQPGELSVCSVRFLGKNRGFCSSSSR